MSERIFDIGTPSFLNIQAGDKCKRIDVMKARRILQTAQSEGTEEARWAKVLSYLATELEVDVKDLAENNALSFQAAINTLVEEHNEDVKKRISSTVSSPHSTQESQKTT